MAAWFGRGHHLEVYVPGLGGSILLSVEIDGAKRSFGGPILIFEPARELTFSDNWDSGGWPVATLITLRLMPLFDACHVELFHHGFERLGADAGADPLGGRKIVITARCLCESVRLSSTGEFGPGVIRHCSRCRRAAALPSHAMLHFPRSRWNSSLAET